MDAAGVAAAGAACVASLTTLAGAEAAGAAGALAGEPEPLPDPDAPCDAEPCDADEPCDALPPCDAAPDEPEPCDAAAEPLPDDAELVPDGSPDPEPLDTVDASVTPVPLGPALALCADGSDPAPVVVELVDAEEVPLVLLLPEVTCSAAADCEAGSLDAAVVCCGAGSDREGPDADDSVLPGASPWKPGVTLTN